MCKYVLYALCCPYQRRCGTHFYHFFCTTTYTRYECIFVLVLYRHYFQK